MVVNGTLLVFFAPHFVNASTRTVKIRNSSGVKVSVSFFYSFAFFRFGFTLKTQN